MVERREVTVDEPSTRVEDQDWSSLTLHAFPSPTSPSSTQRSVFERGTAYRTDVTMVSDGKGTVNFNIGKSEVGIPRGWVLRVQLPPHYSTGAAVLASVDGSSAAHSMLSPAGHDKAGKPLLPFGSHGSPPPLGGGPVMELVVPPATHARVVTVRVGAAVKLVEVGR